MLQLRALQSVSGWTGGGARSRQRLRGADSRRAIAGLSLTRGLPEKVRETRVLSRAVGTGTEGGRSP